MHDDISALFDLSGRTAMVTGAGRGLGERMALTLSRAGAHVVLSARSRDQLEKTAAAIAGEGGSASVAPLDVSDETAVRDAVEGCDRLDILVNAAAVITRGTVVDLEPEQWRRMIDINLSGAYYVARAAARRMIEGGTGGSIVQVGSVQGYVVLRDRVAYTASKGGMMQMVRSFAYELGHEGIRVNGLLPGFFKTDINRDLFEDESWSADVRRHVPLERPGDGRDLDAALLYLVSPGSAYTTGSMVVVDGGLTSGLPL